MCKKKFIFGFPTFCHKLESNSKCSLLKNDYLLLAIDVTLKYYFSTYTVKP